MRNLKVNFVLILIVLNAGVKLFAQDQMDIKEEKLSSTFLNQERELWISLPHNFDGSKQYPVFIVLDAEKYFNLVTTLVDNREKYGKLPPHIIIGIPNPNMQVRSRNMTFSTSGVDQQGESTQRYTRENTGQASAFHNFITKEVIPYVNKKYNIVHYNLIGHSFGGYFALYSSTLSTAFKNYIAIDPSLWYSKGEVITQIEDHIENLKSKPTVKFYLGYQKGGDNLTGKMEGLINFFKENNINTEHWAFSNENHGSVFLPAMLAILQEMGENVQFTPRHKRK